jgi:hypothetical protein
MSTKTSQLQIRVSPGQKEALKRLAEAAGMSVSEYVLATVLPSSRLEFGVRARALKESEGRMKSLANLASFLASLPAADFSETVAGADLGGLPPVLQNYVAATVEEQVHARGLGTPGWVRAIPPLEEPHFAWEIRSLRPHLMRVTPVTFKRRNVFLAADSDARR